MIEKYDSEFQKNFILFGGNYEFQKNFISIFQFMKIFQGHLAFLPVEICRLNCLSRLRSSHNQGWNDAYSRFPPKIGIYQVCVYDKYFSKYHSGIVIREIIIQKAGFTAQEGLIRPQSDVFPFQGWLETPTLRWVCPFFLPTRKIVQHIWGQSLMRIRNKYHDYPNIIKLKSNLWHNRVWRLRTNQEL